MEPAGLLQESDTRDEVLLGWPTGAGASNLEENAERLRRHAWLASLEQQVRQSRRYLACAGYPDVAVHIVWHQHTGAFPSAEDKAQEILSGSAVTAARSGAVRLMLKKGIRIPTRGAQRGGTSASPPNQCKLETNPPTLGEQDLVRKNSS